LLDLEPLGPKTGHIGPKLAGLFSPINTSGRMMRSDKLIEIDRKFRSLDYEFCLAALRRQGAHPAIASRLLGQDGLFDAVPTDEFD
jgi:hypothetical protein